ncbi:unnamed protein product [Anisakis simplex]|uniref:DUF155 domain-containing protein n=1 Tax=Anisakis simplex TaxID=6269 RepID=A0A0M3J769_ANISI|nr:unnamed protein product [Anisakis simplex]
MDRDIRLRAFIEEYDRVISMLDDIAMMKQTLTRIEFLIAILVAQIGILLLVRLLLKKFC